MTPPLHRRALVVVGLLLALLVVSPGPSLVQEAHAVTGLESLGLVWGMTPEQVKAAHATKYEDDVKSQPEGTVKGRLLLTKDVEMFGQRLEVVLYFSASGLAIIRLEYRSPAAGNVETLVDWYKPHWGEALYASERERGRKKREWAWPWEGVEIRSVEEDGKIMYQRVDFSVAVAEEWRRADAMLCSLLPSTTGCPFAETTCPQQDSVLATGTKDQPWELLASEGQVTCSYTGFRLEEMRLVFEKPKEKTAKWLEALLTRRIGTGVPTREETGSQIKLERAWADHALNLIVYRKAVSRLEDGSSTGPVERIRFKRTMAAPSAAPAVITPPQ